MPEMLRRGLVLLALAGVLTTASLAAVDADAEYRKAAATILCDCGCHPQSVADCTCGRAAEMRGDIRKMVDGGMTGDAVIADYVSRYGDKIRIAPTAKGFNLLAWLGPLGLLVLGIGGVAWLARRLSRSGAAPRPAAPEAPAADAAYLERLRHEVEERM